MGILWSLLGEKEEDNLQNSLLSSQKLITGINKFTAGCTNEKQIVSTLNEMLAIVEGLKKLNSSINTCNPKHPCLELEFNKRNKSFTIAD